MLLKFCTFGDDVAVRLIASALNESATIIATINPIRIIINLLFKNLDITFYH